MIPDGPLRTALIAFLAGLLGAGAVLGLQRLMPGAALDKAQIEGVVRDYMLTNPEILPEAMERLRGKETRATITGNKRAILEPYGSAWIGNPKASLTIVEYFDYNCGYCRTSLPTIRQLVARDKDLRIVFREWPILSEESVSAARLSLAAAEQGKFQAFHDALFAGGRVSQQTMAAAARVAGLDMGRVTSAMGRADAEIARNRQTAQALGLTGTPSWVIGDKVVSAALPLEELERAIKDARRSAAGAD